ncbi:hypothetical protein YC2023_100359 [Brassica napus]
MYAASRPNTAEVNLSLLSRSDTVGFMASSLILLIHSPGDVSSKRSLDLRGMWERVYDPQGQVVKLESEEEVVGEKGDKSWLRVSLASRKLRESISARPGTTIEYTLRLTGMHWFVDTLQVVLEKIWEQGFMALAAVGATNIGSIEISIKPELRTHEPKKKLFPAAFLIVWKKALAHLKKETNPQFVMLLCKGVLARNRTNPKQQHVDSHEVAAASDVHGFPEAEQPDLNGGGASSGLQIGKED